MTVQDLVAEYLDAKQEEAVAEARRVAIGEQLAALLDGPEEGSKTHDVGDYKVTVKRVVNRKVDWAAFDALGLTAPPCKIKRELDAAGLRWYMEQQPEAYKKLCKTITATPGRAQIEVKPC